MLADRNADILRHMVEYCNEIDTTINRFGNDYAIFSSDSVYKNAIALCVLQIGELASILTDDFKKVYSDVPWVQIKALRNVVAHKYGKIDSLTLFETATLDVPGLKEYCEKILAEHYG